MGGVCTFGSILLVSLHQARSSDLCIWGKNKYHLNPGRSLIKVEKHCPSISKSIFLLKHLLQPHAVDVLKPLRALICFDSP